jgi:hypothetical protein
MLFTAEAKPREATHRRELARANGLGRILYLHESLEERRRLKCTYSQEYEEHEDQKQPHADSQPIRTAHCLRKTI